MAGKTRMLLGSSPGQSLGDKAKGAMWRALRTLIQGIAAAFPAAGAGLAIIDAGYWKMFAYSVLAAAVTALVSFLNNVATFIPEDPTRQPPPPQPPPG